MGYPTAPDSFTPNVDGVDEVVAADINELQTAITAIETELGTDPAGSAADVKTRLTHALSDGGYLQFDAATELTIASGAVTVTQTYHRLDTESDAASDYLDTISGGAAVQLLLLRITDAGRDVIIRHNVDNISCAGGTNITLGELSDLAILIYDGALSKWLCGKLAAGGDITGAGTAGQVPYLTDVDVITGDAGLAYSTTAGLVVNESGAAAVDTRIESDNNAYMLFVDASADSLGIGTAAGGEIAAFTAAAGVVLNEGGAAAMDLRVESDTEANMLFVDASADALYLGGSTNGVKISKGGEFLLIGTATQWEDLRLEPTARTTGSNAPTFEQWFTNGSGSRGIYLYSFDDAAAGSEKETYFTLQMPHAWAGTAIGIHVHWIGAVADTTSAPRWGLEYFWAEIGATFGNTSIVYTDGSNYTAAGTDANIVQYKHYISKFAAITPSATQDGISSILVGRLFRDSDNAGDTYNAGGAKCGLLYIDAHYEVNTLGSTSEYVK